ncbi:MAG: N-carbamoyl-L-amino acid hydrolase [Myxococcota bacterium]|nr:N-carbamoyl-L-amino acid hydrolase [Myxococcota bacterium]
MPQGPSIERLLNDLDIISRFGKAPGGGYSRPAFGEADMAIRGHFEQEARAAGLECFADHGGNLHAVFPGEEDGPAVISGSHSDSVPHGGNLDGPLGVFSALEVLRFWKESGRKPRRPVTALLITGEEGSRFRKGTLGSSYITGAMTPEFIDALTDGDGQRFDALVARHYPERRRFMVSPGTTAAFVELHIEQGKVLESEAVQIGAVEAITGLTQWQVKVLGEADHAGTTPMNMRHDALSAAAAMIIEVEAAPAHVGPDSVATVGRISAHPGGVNVVPAACEFTVDFRSPDPVRLQRLGEVLRAALNGVAMRREVHLEILELQSKQPGPCDPLIVRAITSACNELHVTCRAMWSGAVHDALHFSRIVPAGMLFVPSIGGKSHSPAEATSPEDIEAGLRVLERVLWSLANP